MEYLYLKINYLSPQDCLSELLKKFNKSYFKKCIKNSEKQERWM